MAPQNVEHERLGALILKMQDGLLEQKSVFRFGKWLECDKKALRYYIEFNQLSAALRSIYDKTQNDIIAELSTAKH